LQGDSLAIGTTQTNCAISSEGIFVAATAAQSTSPRDGFQAKSPTLTMNEDVTGVARESLPVREEFRDEKIAQFTNGS